MCARCVVTHDTSTGTYSDYMGTQRGVLCRGPPFRSGFLAFLKYDLNLACTLTREDRERQATAVLMAIIAARTVPVRYRMYVG